MVQGHQNHPMKTTKHTMKARGVSRTRRYPSNTDRLELKAIMVFITKQCNQMSLFCNVLKGLKVILVMSLKDQEFVCIGLMLSKPKLCLQEV